LADVAAYAGADDILPSVKSALAAGGHVVEAEFHGGELSATVLALVVVAREDITTVELYRLLGQLIVAEQADDARHLDFAVDGANPVVVFLAEIASAVFADLAPGGEGVGGELAVLEADNLGQVLAQQRKGAANRDDMNRHEQLIEDQNAGFQG